MGNQEYFNFVSLPQARRKMDRLSPLPDELISHILSFLPTKHAVSTTILSSRFKNPSLWTSLPSLDFDDTLYLSPVRIFNEDHVQKVQAIFTKFVDNVLSSLRSPSLYKFRLRLSRGRSVDSVNEWLKDVVMRNVVEMDLFITGDECHFEHEDYVVIPSCDSLRVLKINLFESCWVCLPTPQANFIDLRVLDLKMILHDEDILDSSTLIVRFPKLEKLSVTVNFQLEEAFYLGFGIVGASLRSLELVFWGFNYDVSIMVDSPNLQHLRVYDKYLGSQFSFCHLEVSEAVSNLEWLTETDPDLQVGEVYCPSTLYEVNIDVADDSVYYAHCIYERFALEGNPILTLLQRVQATSSLLMSLTSTLALVKIGHANLPIFHNLTKLEMTLLTSGGWELLPQWLEKCPKLEFLILNGEVCPSYIKFVAVEEIDWQEPNSVPTCLLFHLKQIQMKGLGNLAARGFLKYLLKNGKVLEKLITESREYVLDNGVIESILKSLVKPVAPSLPPNVIPRIS